jgi:uncharacterized protein involved in cysteine biosynthesis
MIVNPKNIILQVYMTARQFFEYEICRRQNSWETGSVAQADGV